MQVIKSFNPHIRWNWNITLVDFTFPNVYINYLAYD